MMLRQLYAFSFAAAVMVVGALIQPPKEILPVDEAKVDPSFLEFRTTLRRAVAAHDLKRVLGVVDPRINLGTREFGPGALMRQLGSGDHFLTELGTVLDLGGRFVEPGVFCAPYVFTEWPNDYIEPEYERYIVVTDRQVPVHISRSRSSAILEYLSYSVVLSEQEWGDGWWEVRTEKGEGFVERSKARSPFNYYACFEKREDRWRLTDFAGPIY